MRLRPALPTVLAATAALVLPLVAAAQAPAATLTARDLATSAGLTDVSTTQGQNCVLDLNGDGVRDLVLSRHGLPWLIMHGRSDGTFVAAGQTDQRDRHGCVTGDFGGVAADGGFTGPDGLTDYYMTVGACKGTCTKAYPNELWLHRPNHTFVNATAAFGVADEHGRGREPMTLDVDNDGRHDLYVGNEESQLFFSANRLYRNASGRFTEITDTPVTSEVGSDCSTSGDVDGDGWTDILSCGTTGTYAYRNNGGTSFTDVSSSTGLATSVPKDLELGDVDGDGRTDLVVIRGSRVELRLNRNGTFGTVDYSLTINAGRNAALADADGDGRLDVYVVQGKNSTYKDILLLNAGRNASTGKWQLTSFPIPQTTVGDGDTVGAIPDWRGSGRAAFLVNNGRFSAKGPRQLIHLAP